MRTVIIESLVIEAHQAYLKETGINHCDLDDSDYVRIASNIFAAVAEELTNHIGDPRVKNMLLQKAEVEV